MAGVIWSAVQPLIHGVLGGTIERERHTTAGDLRIEFSRGELLEVSDESTQFESYEVSSRDKTIVV
jgi:hypothetical protein